MKIVLSFFTLFFTACQCFCMPPCGTPNSLKSYFELEKEYPFLFENIGNAEEKEIQLITNPDDIYRICKLNRERLSNKNLPFHWADIGIFAEDQYFYFIRDAVRFPSGYEGTYDRIVSKASKNNTPGVAVLIQLPDGSIALNINYRHATRVWELELPRGLCEKNEALEDTARREAMEETGYLIDEPILLGWMNPDSGILASKVAIFYTKASKITCSSQEETESIAKIQSFTIEEIKEILEQGIYRTKVAGKEKKIYARDPFLTYALCLAQIKKLL